MLKQEDLEKLVDGTVGDFNRGLNEVFGYKCRYYQYIKDVRGEIKEYSSVMKERFLPVVVKDFNRPLSIKFTSGNLSSEDLEKLEEFKKMVRDSNSEEHRDKLIEKSKYWLSVVKKKEFIKLWENLVIEKHNKLMEVINGYVRGRIKEWLKENSKKKCAMETMVYNFTDNEVPSCLVKEMRMGINSVPEEKLNNGIIKRRVYGTLLEFLQRYMGKILIKELDGDEEAKIRYMLEKSIDQGGPNALDYKFYKNMNENLCVLKQELRSCCKTGNEAVGNVPDLENVKVEGCAFVWCDKGLGISLFELKTLGQAELRLIEQFKADKSVFRGQ